MSRVVGVDGMGGVGVPAAGGGAAGDIAAGDAVLRTVLRGCWASLPALLAGSVAVCVAAVLVGLAAPGVNVVSVLLAALLVAPTGAALVVVVDRIADDRPATVRDALRAMLRVGPTAVGHAVVPAVCGVLFLVALLVWDDGRHPLALPSLAVTGAGAVLAVLGHAVVLTLLADDARRPARVLWLAAAGLVAARPTRFLAAGCLLGLGLWAAMTASASVLLLVPAPVAIALVAATRTTLAERA